MTLVAMSASYGAGSTVVAPALAERLGVPFVDRAIPLAVAEQLQVTPGEAEAHEESTNPSWLERMLRGFIGSDPGAPAPLPAAAAWSRTHSHPRTALTKGIDLINPLKINTWYRLTLRVDGASSHHAL